MSYFSRIQLDADHPQARDALHGVADAYRDHQLLWLFFPADAGTPRDFLFRRIDSPGGGAPVFFTVSQRPPTAPSAGWSVQSRDYRPQLRSGDRLAFELRVNPVRTHARDGKRKRDDVVMHAKKRILAEQGVDAWAKVPEAAHAALYDLVNAEVGAWFAGRDGREGVIAAHGFSVVPGSLQADAYRQHRFSRGADAKPIRISTVDLSGTLEVTDPGRAEAALLQGIGHAKAFGCGLLLVRRPG